MVPIEKLIFDPDYFPRGFADYRTVARYKSAMEAGNKFPPLIVTPYDVGFLILDGVHRYQAFRKVGAEKIPVYVEDIPQDMWLATAATLNSRNARPLTNKELTNLVHKLRSQGFKDQEIAEFLTTSEEWIYQLAERAIFRSSNGDREPISLKKAMLEVKGLVQSKVDDPDQNFNLKAIQKNMSGQSQAKMVEQLVHLVEEDLLNLESEDLVVWLARLKQAICD